jgi:fructose-specific phosphotransferase system IIB component
MSKLIVGVCSCPNGIAHTYMAADELTAKAKKLGYRVKIETQGSTGIEEKLTKEEIEEANVIIMCTEIALREPERFVGYEDKIVSYGISYALRNAKKVIEESVRD